MELFNENKNKYFECIQSIINDIINGNNYSDKDIINIIRKNGFNEPDIEFEKAILNENRCSNNSKLSEYGKINLLKKEANNYYPVIKSSVPIRPSSIELQWLKMMLEDNRVNLHLDESVAIRLKERLKKLEVELNLDFWIKKNIDMNGDSEDNEKLKENIRILSEAIQKKKFIKYTSFSEEGKQFVNKVGCPFKIEYSIRNNKYRVAVLIENEDNKEIRVAKVIVSNFQTIELCDNSEHLVAEEIINFYNNKKNTQQPLVLEVEDKNNAKDRCFHLFSFYDKEAYYDREKNMHILKIFYYSFDEGEIIKDILSLGSSVVVLEPVSIRNKVIERIRKAFYC